MKQKEAKKLQVKTTKANMKLSKFMKKLNPEKVENDDKLGKKFVKLANRTFKLNSKKKGK